MNWPVKKTMLGESVLIAQGHECDECINSCVLM